MKSNMTQKERYIEILQEVDEPLRSEIIENLDENFERFYDTVEEPYDCLMNGFSWRSSKKGFDYWVKVCGRL